MDSDFWTLLYIQICSFQFNSLKSTNLSNMYVRFWFNFNKMVIIMGIIWLHNHNHVMYLSQHIILILYILYFILYYKVSLHAYMFAPMCWRSRLVPQTFGWVVLYSATGSIPTVQRTLQIPAPLPARRNPPRWCQKRLPRKCSTSLCLDPKKNFSTFKTSLRKKKKLPSRASWTAVKQIISRAMWS